MQSAAKQKGVLCDHFKRGKTIRQYLPLVTSQIFCKIYIGLKLKLSTIPTTFPLQC